MQTASAIVDQRSAEGLKQTAASGRSPFSQGDPDSSPRNSVDARPVKLRGLLNEIWDGCWSWNEWTPGTLTRLLAVFLFVCVCSWSGIALSRESEGVATIWLSNGIVFGLLITQSPRRWLPYFAAGLTADTLADMIYGDPFRLAFGVSLANSVEVVFSAVVLSLLFGVPLDLSRRRPLAGFLAVSVVGATALTSALGATWTLHIEAAGPWGQLFRTWWLGDILGMAVLAPVTIILQRASSYTILRPGHLRHTSLVLLLPAATTVLVFTHSGDPLIFLLFPTLLLVVFRLGFAGTVLTVVLVTLMAIGFTVKGFGPLMLIPGQHMLLHRIVVAQLFAAVSIFSMFPVAALLEEQAALKLSLAEGEARYRRLAQTDELTGLANRRAFNRQLASAWEQAATEGTFLGLLLVDADHFKHYNDVFGHLEGDECLQSLATTLAQALGANGGMAARYGGEEFAILLPGANSETTRDTAEKLRLAVVQQRLPHPTGPSGIQTVSIGGAALVPGADQTAAALVKQADEALYSAKLGGRNQVSCV